MFATSAGEPRHCLLATHLRLLPVLRGHVPGGATRGVPTGGDAELLLPGVRPLRHRTQAGLPARPQVGVSAAALLACSPAGWHFSQDKANNIRNALYCTLFL